MDHINSKLDPIGYVLNALWADATENGRWDADVLLRMLVANKNYAEAMMLAVAIELDKAKREEASSFWNGADVDAMLKAGVLNEVGERRLIWFLANHLNDRRELRGRGAPPPPPPPVTIDLPPARPAPPPIKE